METRDHDERDDGNGSVRPEDKREPAGRPEGHRRRLREKFLRGGLNGFLDYEVLELLLALATPRRDCRELARRLLAEYRSLRAVLEADVRELLRFKGLGPRNVFGLRFVQEVSGRFLRDRMMSRPYYRSSKEVFDYLYHSLRDVKREKFKVLFLDTKNRIIEEKTLFEGTVDSSAVYPREVVKDALRYDASSLIFIHNHPSGDPEPSLSDRQITRELVFAAKVLQLKVLDHIIIGQGCYFSFADQGLIEDYDLLFHEWQRKN
ncbi:MAG: DNA repair protein RadC [Candidatus Aminicenantes bacterium]|nr:DNA repair protein RadC [Candidatus Aminicenantes bacterium]